MRADHFFEEIRRRLPRKPCSSPVPLQGGCIHDAWQWGSYFIKSNTLDHFANFEAEAENLRAIHASGTIRVPELILLGRTTESAFLILEHLKLFPNGDEARLGEQLGAMHHHEATTFGFHVDNFIGSTPQPNLRTDDWKEFFITHRIGRMLDRLKRKGIQFSGCDTLRARLSSNLPSTPRASLLHGDLWSGNKAFLADGTPVVFDPACYYGHAACDLAMTTLFGGFSRSFYDAYRSSSELDDPSLHEAYNLYHILNHALLFGGTYVTQADRLIRRLA